MKQVHLGTLSTIKDKVLCQGKKTVIHWGLLPVGRKSEPWVIATNVLSVSGYVRRHLPKNERFYLRDCPAELLMQMNEEQLGSMSGDLYAI